MSKTLLLCLCFSFIPIGLASSWDGFPVISQIKSIVQAVAGDADGAKQTQANFLRQMPVLSQLTSAVQAATGDFDGAKKTQQQFLTNTIEAPVNSIPVVGHIKGGIHIALGDKERGMEIIKGATSNTFATIGGLVAGPGGAVAGKVIGDGVITAIDSAKSGEFTPHGFMQISPNASAGDNFDRVLEIAVTMEASRANGFTSNIISEISDQDNVLKKLPHPQPIITSLFERLDKNYTHASKEDLE